MDFLFDYLLGKVIGTLIARSHPVRLIVAGLSAGVIGGLAAGVVAAKLRGESAALPAFWVGAALGLVGLAGAKTKAARFRDPNAF